MRRKGLGSPVEVLVGLALLIFIVGVFNFGNLIYFPTVLLDVESVGTIGRGESNIRHIPLGNAVIDLREEAAPSIEEHGPITLARGVITLEEHEIVAELSREELETISSSKLGFDVLKSNEYGTMTVRLNGHLIWSGNPKEGERVDIDLGLFRGIFTVGGNRIKFSTTSSGWRIWSPAIYVIDAVKLEANVLKTSQKAFEFGVSDSELENCMLGRVAFTVQDAGFGTDLFIKINNVTVWRGSPKPGNLPTLVDFSNIVTGLGTRNVLSFGVERAGRYQLEDIDILIFNSGEGTSSSTFSFNISQENLEALRQGRLKGVVVLEVETVEKGGTLTVSVIGEDEFELMKRSVGAGKIELNFTDREIRTGTNIIMLKSSGLYEVGELKIKLVNR